MADINSPKEFLSELSELVDGLNKSKEELREYTEKKSNLEGTLAAIRNGIEREKNETVKSRRADLEKGFDKQIKEVDSKLEEINSRRKKALDEGMKQRAEEATKGVRAQIDTFKNAFKTYVEAQKLPAILKSTLYYKLFCPGIVGYLIYLAIFIAILLFAGFTIKSRFTEGSPVMPFVVLAVIDISLFFIYIAVWSNTRVKYRDEIKNCLNILESIRKNEKTTKDIEDNIKKTGDDSSYDLHEYDEEIAAENQKKAQLKAQKATAVNQFEAETRARLIEDIELSHKEKVDGKLEEIRENDELMKKASEKTTELETRLNHDFISYVGAKNITHERISRLIELVDNGEAATVSEAVAKLEQ